jgi:hypothetical protein
VLLFSLIRIDPTFARKPTANPRQKSLLADRVPWPRPGRSTALIDSGKQEVVSVSATVRARSVNRQSVSPDLSESRAASVSELNSATCF